MQCDSTNHILNQKEVSEKKLGRIVCGIGKCFELLCSGSSEYRVECGQLREGFISRQQV